ETDGGVRGPAGRMAGKPHGHSGRPNGRWAGGFSRPRRRRVCHRGGLHSGNQIRRRHLRSLCSKLMAAALEVRNLSKLFFQQTPKGWGGLLVLEDLSFEVREREFVSILGPSGCGKTTLARILAGIEPSDRGEFFIDGRQPGPPGTGRCLVFQNYGLLAW